MHVSELPDRSQDYLKKIYDLQEWGLAGTGEARGATLSTLATELGQRRSTASEAVKRLVADGLVVHAPYGDITLSEEGRRLALEMVRRHRLIETYLLRELGYGRDEVHSEAEVLEHAVSDLFIARIDAAMGYPARDPHGDPIPDPEGRVVESVTVPLSQASLGERLWVDRISDRDGALLRYLEDHGVLPGAMIEVGERPYPDMAAVKVFTRRAGNARPTDHAGDTGGIDHAGGTDDAAGIANGGGGGGIEGMGDAEPDQIREVQLSSASLDAVLCRPVDTLPNPATDSISTPVPGANDGAMEPTAPGRPG